MFVFVVTGWFDCSVEHVSVSLSLPPVGKESKLTDWAEMSRYLSNRMHFMDCHQDARPQEKTKKYTFAFLSPFALVVAKIRRQVGRRGPNIADAPTSCATGLTSRFYRTGQRTQDTHPREKAAAEKRATRTISRKSRVCRDRPETPTVATEQMSLGSNWQRL